MPYSDNLYSANDESDGESFSDELSPTDGYFNRRNMPTDTLVPDPSQTSRDNKDTEDKVLIPGREARRNPEIGARATDSQTLSQLYPSRTATSAAASERSPSSPVSNTPSSPISSRRTLDSYVHSPRLPPPPPAYSASPPTSPVAPVFPQARTYNTFEQHLPQGFPQRDAPESMGTPPGREPTETTPLAISSPESSPPSRKPRRSSFCRTLIRKVLFVALVITVISALLTTMLNWKNRDSGNNRNPSYSTPSKSYCSYATIKKDREIYSFASGRDLTVLQTVYDGKDDSEIITHVTTSGEIRIRRLPKEAMNYGPHFTVDVLVSSENLAISSSWDVNSRVLDISTPSRTAVQSRGPHCISLEITAWLPEGAEFTNLKVGSVQLSLKVFEDVKVQISESAQFSTVVGDVGFPTFENTKGKSPLPPKFEIPGYEFNSRRLDIETVSGMITGLYPLYDHLGIKSQSGNVAVGIFPRTIDPDVPSPADLDVKTSSGSIDVRLPLVNIENPKFTPPARNYITQVTSVSAQIKGSFYLGSATSIKSTSGAISFNALPVILSSGKGTSQYTPLTSFETRTESGSTEVEILEPVFVSLLASEPRRPRKPYQPIGDGDPYLLLPPMEEELFDEGKASRVEEQTLRSLQSNHGSTSGSISVIYPPSYEGTILGKAVTGKISITGKGVEKIWEKNNWGNKELYSKKGVDNVNDGSAVEMRNIAGGLQFTIGDV